MSKGALPVLDCRPEQPAPEPEIPSPVRPQKVVLPVLLFTITVLTTLYAGFSYYAGFVSQTPEQAFALQERVFQQPWLLLYGASFSLALLVILLAHEMGHYLSCRYYGIDATLPFVLPAPPFLPLPPPLSTYLGTWYIPFNPFGTFGAVIRIRSPFLNRRQLFDVGIAGPLAGFAFIVPILFAGIYLSKDFVLTSPQPYSMVFGEPLIFHMAVSLLYSGADPAHINLHPIGWGAWFGLLATSLNLMPIGQLDGGHVVYALFGHKAHRIVSIATFVALIALGIVAWPGYLFFSVIVAVLGFRHPRPYLEGSQIGRGRRWIALLGLVILILTFIPVPVDIIENFGSG